MATVIVMRGPIRAIDYVNLLHRYFSTRWKNLLETIAQAQLLISVTIFFYFSDRPARSVTRHSHLRLMHYKMCFVKVDTENSTLFLCKEDIEECVLID